MPSAGTIKNMRRVEAGSADLALAAIGPAYEAWTIRAPPWTGNPPLRRARAVLPMYETPLHLATVTAAGLTTAASLAGKSVGVGPRGGSNERIFQKLAEGSGIAANLVSGDPGELAQRVIRRKIDALLFGADPPIPIYARIAAEAGIVFIPLDGAARDALRRAFPYLIANAIPENTCRGRTALVSTGALWNFVVAREDLPADVVKSAARAILSDPALTRAVHPAASAMVSGNVGADTFIPFHPGALHYFEGAGVPTNSLPR